MYVCKNIKVSCRTIEGTAYIVNEQTRELHKLNQVGTIIWDLINGERAVDQIIAESIEQFEGQEDEIKEGVLAFISDLFEKDLVLLSETKFEGVYVSEC